jgi:hypothetical protein
MSSPAARPRTWRIVLVAVAALVAVNVLAAALGAVTGGTPGGPRSSSYATGGDGLAALHDLLRDSGHPVEQLRRAPGRAALDPASTVFVLDPQDIDARDTRALRRFAEAGGTLVAGGEDPGSWLGQVVPGAPLWQRAGATTAHPLAPVAEIAAVRTVTAAGAGSWRATRGALPVLGSSGRPILAVTRLGRGRVDLLADVSALQNRMLARDDNAALGVALAGPAGRRVAFAESVHGYGEATGPAAIPSRWKWLLGGLLLAALAFVASRVRRLGPVEAESRALPPPRRAYVDAVAAALSRTRKPAATAERLREAARKRVAQRGALGADRSPESLARAAARLGLDDEEAAALTRPSADSEEDLLLAGRALARTNGRHA